MKKPDDFPRVLVVSNNGFSQSSSNGRTLGNFFKGWPKEKLAQFFISGRDLSFDICENYFQVTDEEALKAFKGFQCEGGLVVEKKRAEAEEGKTYKKTSRNALTMLLRNIVWRSGRWKKCGFNDWVSAFSPDIVLLQAGDFAFMYQLALGVAKRQNAKIVIYNSEGYYFKNFDFFRSKGFAKLVYPIFLKDLRRCLRSMYTASSYIFYICDDLKNDYDKEFSDIPSETIYTSSDMPICPIETNSDRFVISYCGGLGNERHKSLIEVADCLQSISTGLFLDVYGKAPNEKVIEELSNCYGIRYHGFVPYSEVQNVIMASNLVVHVESFDEFYKEDLKYGFSTKIADLLSSGKCFLLYAPDNLACTKYLLKNQGAFVVTEKKRLYNVLCEIINDTSIRGKYRNRALDLANSNHNCGKNMDRFQQALKLLCNNN